MNPLEIEIPTTSTTSHHQNIKQKNLTIVERLGLSRAPDWKLMVRDLENLEEQHPEMMQQVLDYVSPTKSPIRDVLPNIGNPDEGVVNDEYVFTSSTSNLLGEGISKVKLAKHIKTGGMVAIKVFDKKQQKQQNNSLIREIMVLGGLYHPHINPILQVVDSLSHVYMIMRLEKGGDLFSYIEGKTKLDETETVALFRQILSVVSFLHSNRIIHRDIKPENILMDESHTQIKLCDFVFASVCDPAKPFEDFCGSPEYAAPEMIGRKPYLGPEVDIWSLGVVLYTCHTGCLPFPEQNKSKLYLSIMTAKYTIPSYVSETAQSLIKQILVTQISRRFTLADIFSHPYVSSNPTPILINNAINTIPSIKPVVKNRLRDLSFTSQEIEEYERTGLIGPVKAAAFLLDEELIPRGGEGLKRRQSSQNLFSSSKYTKTEVGYVKAAQARQYPKELESDATSPLAQIKLSMSTEQDVDMDDDEDIAPQTVTFQHQSNRHAIHTLLMQKILGSKGRLIYREEEDPDTMVFEIGVAKNSNNVSLFACEDGMDIDPEIQACFQEATTVSLITVQVSTLPVNNDPADWYTIFKLLKFAAQDRDWILDQFDGVCLDLMK